MTPEQELRERARKGASHRQSASTDEQPVSGRIKSRSPGRASSSASATQPDEAGARRAKGVPAQGGWGRHGCRNLAAESEAAAVSKHGVSCEAGKQRRARRTAACGGARGAAGARAARRGRGSRSGRLQLLRAPSGRLWWDRSGRRARRSRAARGGRDECWAAVTGVGRRWENRTVDGVGGVRRKTPTTRCG